MSESTAAQPASDEPETSAQPVPAGQSRPWKALAGALAVGLVVGGGLGAGAVVLASGDPSDTAEYQALEQDLRQAERSADRAERSAERAESNAEAATSSAAPSSSSGNAAGNGAGSVGEVGQTMTNEGVTLTVTAARVADVIELNQSSYQQGSGYETYTQVPPAAGGKYVIVDTHIVNDGQVSMDLTCSYPIATVLVDDRDRQFDTIDSLYEIRDNPDCNAQLQPGFESEMTYIYMVPADANISGFAFRDASELGNNNDFTAVRLTL